MPEAALRDRLGHMLEAIEAIQRYTSGKSEAAFAADGMLRDAVERNLARLSEASRYIPDDLAARHPEVPWRQVADLGNVLRHAYDRVATPRIWAIVQRDLAPLKAAIETMLASAEGSNGEGRNKSR